MRSIGFGLERVALAALARPRMAALLFLAVVALFGYGLTRLTFDEDLRNVFAGDTQAFEEYQRATAEFVDPENETLVLVEGKSLGTPENFAKLGEFQFALQLIDGVDSVYSLFALREPPDANGDAPLVVDDAATGLTAERAATIRAHPILGAKLLNADATAMVFVVTPTEAKAPLAVSRRLNGAVQEAADSILRDTGLIVTVTGFPAIRAGIVAIVEHDQLVLNGAGALIGFFMSLIVFRSLVGALLTAGPAILGGLAVLGGMGLFGVPVTVMSNVAPVLVMILGYVDGMHLSHAWRQHRDAGSTVAEAEWQAQKDVGAACVLAALTTSVAFLSLLIADTAMVRDFGWVGAVGTIAGSLVVLVAHALGMLLIGRYWRARNGPAPDLLAHLARPSAALCRFAINHANLLSFGAVALFVVFLVLHYSVPPEHSVREHLPKSNPANAALGRIDKGFGGVFPVEIIVPLHDAAPTSPAALEKIAAVHGAAASVDGAHTPLSLWSLVEWLGGKADAETGKRLDALLGELGPATESRFFGKSGALISVSIEESPSYRTEALIGAIERATRAAGGDDVGVTGVTVVTTREAVATIDNLNLSLTLDVFANLALIMIAFRNVPIGAVSFLPNIIPILGVGTFLFFLGRGMQMTSVVALTVAFGIAVDNTIHYINRFHLLGRNGPMRERLIETSRQIGPVMLGTTLIIIAGLSTTLTSGLPTIALFGMITAATLTGALLSSLIVLPALMAGLARRWFESGKSQTTAVGGARAEAPP